MREVDRNIPYLVIPGAPFGANYGAQLRT